MADEPATDEPSRQPWFEFRVEDTAGAGVDAAKLSKLLADLSSSFYAIARVRLGREAARPGRRAVDEEALAAIRILRVSPGSVIIEADPPTIGAQGQLDLGDTTAEDVLFDFALEAQKISRGEASSFQRPEVRRRIQETMRDAAEIGRVSEIIVRPRGQRVPPGLVSGQELRVRLKTDAETVPLLEEAPRTPRKRRLSGHAYMVDVEPGRYRIRLKLPDGRDLTLDADAELAGILRSAVDQVVEVEAVEELEGDQVASRLAIGLSVLPSSGIGSDKPPKTLDELAEEQGLLGEPPDYRELATLVWETDEQLAQFDEYLQRSRRAAS